MPPKEFYQIFWEMPLFLEIPPDDLHFGGRAERIARTGGAGGRSGAGGRAGARTDGRAGRRVAYMREEGGAFPVLRLCVE